MKLSPDEVKQIDAALELLKRSLNEEFTGASKAEKAVPLEDAFLKQVADKYLSSTGVVRLLADARLQEGQRAGCVCGCSCAEPSKGLIWY